MQGKEMEKLLVEAAAIEPLKATREGRPEIRCGWKRVEGTGR